MDPALEAQSLNLWTTTEIPPLVSENWKDLAKALEAEGNQEPRFQNHHCLPVPLSPTPVL